MRMPDECGEPSGKVVLLNRSLYGLKQSARTWLDLLISTLQASGFEQSMSEPYLLRLKDPKSKKIRMILAVQVDDMIVAGSKKDCDWLRSALSEVFPVNDLGELTWYTGCSFKRDVKKGTRYRVQTACNICPYN